MQSKNLNLVKVVLGTTPEHRTKATRYNRTRGRGNISISGKMREREGKEANVGEIAKT